MRRSDAICWAIWMPITPVSPPSVFTFFGVGNCGTAMTSCGDWACAAAAGASSAAAKNKDFGLNKRITSRP